MRSYNLLSNAVLYVIHNQQTSCQSYWLHGPENFILNKKGPMHPTFIPWQMHLTRRLFIGYWDLDPETRPLSYSLLREEWLTLLREQPMSMPTPLRNRMPTRLRKLEFIEVHGVLEIMHIIMQYLGKIPLVREVLLNSMAPFKWTHYLIDFSVSHNIF